MYLQAAPRQQFPIQARSSADVSAILLRERFRKTGFDGKGLGSVSRLCGSEGGGGEAGGPDEGMDG